MEFYSKLVTHEIGPRTTRHKINTYIFFLLQDVMTFGRPGCGAPVRTRSGRLRTILVGNPEIRFQNNESVQKTIYNTIRYQQNKEDQEQYKRDLGNNYFLKAQCK